MKSKSRMAVHCKTEEQARAFIKECYKQGFTWWGNKFTYENTFWYNYEQDTVYFLNDRYITYGELDYYETRTHDFKLYEYDDLFEKRKPLNEELTDLVDELFKNLQYRMCVNNCCPYEHICDQMLDELNKSLCDVLSDMDDVNKQLNKKKESKIERIGQTGSIFKWKDR